MKKLFILAVVMFLGVAANAQSAIENYFKKYEDNKDFSTVYVSPKMFSILTKATGDNNIEDLELFKSLKGLTVLSTEKNGLKYHKEAKENIPTNDFDELVKVRDKGQKVNIYAKSTDREDIVKEVLLLVGEPTNFTLVSFVGDIKLEDLNKLANKLDIKGTEHLNKVNK